MPHSVLRDLDSHLEQLIQRLQRVLHENRLLHQQVNALKNEHAVLSEKNQRAVKKIKDTMAHLREKIHERT